MATSPKPPAFEVASRRPLPESRFNLYAGLAATTVAALSYLAFLSMRTLPPADLATVMFATAPLCALLALPVLVSRAWVEDDDAIRWFSCSLVLAVVAMVLQLISLPAIIGGRGPFDTDDQGSAQLYLLFHLVLAVGALAAVFKVNTRWCGLFAAVSVVVILLAALNLLPSPTLIGPAQEFTGFLTVLQVSVAVLLALALFGWVLRSGPISTPLHGWISLTLLMLTYEVVLNAVSKSRFDAVWWASLTLRAAAFIVLVAGVTVAVTHQLRRFEGYSERELARREAELDESTMVGEQLLGAANVLSAVVLPTEVAEVLANSVSKATGISHIQVFDLSPRETGLRELYGKGASDEAAGPRLAELSISGPAILVTGSASTSEGEQRERLGPLGQEWPTILALPLRAGGRAIGVMVATDSRPASWTDWKRELLLGLGAQAGPALSRARLYEREHSAAEALQRALLPERLPELPTVQLAGRYTAGQHGVRVGGDWYDCIELPDGRVALIVGDVMGKGLHSASLMGRLRDATRVLVGVDPSPSAVLEGLNEALLGMDTDRIATVAYLLLDLTTYEVQIGLAGHPPPIFASGIAEPRLLGADARSPLLGLPADYRRQSTFQAEVGGVLVLFTDGLVEDRTGIADGLARVLSTTARLTAEGATADALATALLEEGATGGVREDDVALLVAVIGGVSRP